MYKQGEYVNVYTGRICLCTHRENMFMYTPAQTCLFLSIQIVNTNTYSSLVHVSSNYCYVVKDPARGF